MSQQHLGPLETEPHNVRPPFDQWPQRIEQQRGETTDQWRARYDANHLDALLEAIGPDIELGAYDRGIIEWLAHWDPGTIGTIASLFYRLRTIGGSL